MVIAVLLLVVSVQALPVFPNGFDSAKHVLLIGVDGVGSVHLDNSTHLLPNFALFYKEGSVSLPGVARSELITVSAPNWAALITGMSPSHNGNVDRTWVAPNSERKDVERISKCSMCNVTEELLEAEELSDIKTVPSISIKDCTTVLWDPPESPDTHKLSSGMPESMWASAKKQDPLLRVAVVYSWQWIRHLVTDESVDWSYNCQGDDDKCIDKLVELITDMSPQLAFLQLDSVDHTAHIYGFGSPQYYTVLQRVDGYIGKILTVLERSGILNDTLIMITSDHGGYQQLHGHFNQENVFIPALFLGPGVRKGGRLSRSISLRDFAPTALNGLGLKTGEHMRGNVIEEMY